ncbi:uncharacterized protein LOC121735624 [Aricia agestis]|uniref:uncharacterized protein LOC121735624 n=1 Tax=Aricia agestis TaxID=91739 RepID=UPI001C207228|nr:uncharacterized protein LOC121735624 [Aricia agestis]
MSDRNRRSNKSKYYCCVFGCFNTNATIPELSFFKLPVEQERRLQWLRLIDREDLINRFQSCHLVCEAHFRKEDITKNNVRKLLTKNCLPSLNLPTDPKKVDKYTQVEIISASGSNEIDLAIGTSSCQTDINTTNNPGFSIWESSGVEQPSCSSFADSDMEQEHPEEKLDPTTFMEIKQEVLWGGEQSSKEHGAAQTEQGAGEAAPPRGVQERGILEELRREMGTVARRDEVSSGLEEIRQEIRGLAQGDEFDAFGRYVASLLRNMRPRRASHAQPLLINLLAAEMMKQNDDDLA